MSSVQWFMLVVLSLLLTAGVARAGEVAACVPELAPPQGQVFQLLPQTREIRAKFGSSSYSQAGPPGNKRGPSPGQNQGPSPGGAAPMSDEKRESWERLVMMRVKNSACEEAEKPGRKGMGDDDDDPRDSGDRPGRGGRPGMGGAGGPNAGAAELKGVPQELANDPDFLTDVEEAKENRARVCTKKRIEEAKDEQIAAIRARKCEASADGVPGGEAGPGGGPGGPPDRDFSDRDDNRESKGMSFGGSVHLDASARREVDEATDKWEEKCKAERAQNQKNAPARNVASPMGGAGNMAGPGAMGMGGGQSAFGGGLAGGGMRPQMANYMAGYSAPYLFVGNPQQSSSTSSFAGYPFSSGYYGYNQGTSSIPFAQTTLPFLSGQSGLGFRSLWGNTYGVNGTSNRTF